MFCSIHNSLAQTGCFPTPTPTPLVKLFLSLCLCLFDDLINHFILYLHKFIFLDIRTELVDVVAACSGKRGSSNGSISISRSIAIMVVAEVVVVVVEEE